MKYGHSTYYKDLEIKCDCEDKYKKYVEEDPERYESLLGWYIYYEGERVCEYGWRELKDAIMWCRGYLKGKEDYEAN